MENCVLTVWKGQESEKIIEKSRFVTYSRHVESEAEGKAFLAEIRGKHSFATHCCYAFVADKTGNLQRFSDDGEPQGTAGMPILEVLRNKKLFETAVAVVRYFGGVKLGAGGLVRAYSACAAENLEAAELRSLELCTEYEIIVGYTETDAARKFFSSRPCELLNEEYGERVVFRVAVKKSVSADFAAALIDFLQGRAELLERGGYYRAFKV